MILQLQQTAIITCCMLPHSTQQFGVHASNNQLIMFSLVCNQSLLPHFSFVNSTIINRCATSYSTVDDTKGICQYYGNANSKISFIFWREKIYFRLMPTLKYQTTTELERLVKAYEISIKILKAVWITIFTSL